MLMLCQVTEIGRKEIAQEIYPESGVYSKWNLSYSHFYNIFSQKGNNENEIKNSLFTTTHKPE